MVLEELNDQQFYRKPDSNAAKRTMSKTGKFNRKFKVDLTKKELDYLTHFEMKTSNFYGRSKTHKIS